MTNGSTGKWTNWKVERMIEGHCDGLSAGQIARERLLGEFSRNAVVGKLYRARMKGLLDNGRRVRTEGVPAYSGKPKPDPIVLSKAEPKSDSEIELSGCGGLMGKEHCGGTIQPRSTARLCAECNRKFIRARPRNREREVRSLSDPAGNNW